jgi:hypothetical protein
MKIIPDRLVIVSACAQCCLAMFMLAGCSGSSSDDRQDHGGNGGGGGNGGNEVATIVASLGDHVTNVQLVANQETEIRFTYTLPFSPTELGNLSIDIAESLSYVSLGSAPMADTTPSLGNLPMLAALAAITGFAEEAEITAHISYAGDPDVCDSPLVHGPYSVSGSIGGSLASLISSTEPDEETLTILNAGSLDICVKVSSPIDAYVTATNVVVNAEPCGSPPHSITGHWSGPYQCFELGANMDTDEPLFGGIVDLVITQNQDGSYHYVDDGGANYNGHLCGNKYKHSGGVPQSYKESGTFTITGSTTATKFSIYYPDPPSPFGDGAGKCRDQLTKLN